MKLAINGGKKIREKKFPAYNNIGEDEKSAVSRVMDSGVLSRFIGGWGDNFLGGPEVRALEEEWADMFRVKHAVSVNSATSGLYAAVAALGVDPGEEVIVSPYTMSASAVAPLLYGAIPVFADIENDYFCLDVDSVRKKITPRTRGIIIVDIFGLPYDARGINALAKEHGLWVVEDAAQSICARFNGKFAGTLGDVGVYSLNYHKHIHCGEGGIIVTDNDETAQRLRLVRNHAESVVENAGVEDISNLVGHNFRMTELHAAIARCQLKKVPKLVARAQENANYIGDQLNEIPGLQRNLVREEATHAYYAQPMLYDKSVTGILRNDFIDAVKAELPLTEMRELEGVSLGYGYVKPLYLLPVFQRKIAFGRKGFPFQDSGALPQEYRKGLCPVCEFMHEESLVSHEFMRPSMSKSDMDDVVAAFQKVTENIRELKTEKDSALRS